MHNKAVLDNGLSIIVNPMPYSRSVSVVIFTGTGSCHENPEEAGISHFIEHLCFKGTRHRPTSKDISQAIEGVGGILNASTGKEATAYWGKVTSSHFPLLLDTLSDLVLNPLLRQEDLEQERSVIIEEINMSLDSPQQRVSMLIDELLWPEQPLGRDIAGSKETVSSISRTQILEYFSRYYLPNNTVVSIAGDIEPAETIDRVASLFNNWTTQQAPPKDYFLDQEQFSARLQVNTRESEQAHLCLAIHGLPYTHPQRFILDMLNTVLGEGMSSRLFIEIRENKGLAYDIHSYTNHFRSSGSLIIYAGTDASKVETATSVIIEELFKLKQEISLEELVRARELLKGRIQLEMEDNRNLAMWMGSQEIMKRDILSLEQVFSIFDSVTLEDLARVAEELIHGDKLNMAIVGPGDESVPLKKLLRI